MLPMVMNGHLVDHSLLKVHLRVAALLNAFFPVLSTYSSTDFSILPGVPLFLEYKEVSVSPWAVHCVHVYKKFGVSH